MNKSVEGNNFSSQNGKRQDGVRCILNQESKTTKIKMLVSRESLQICIFYDQCVVVVYASLLKVANIFFRWKNIWVWVKKYSFIFECLFVTYLSTTFIQKKEIILYDYYFLKTTYFTHFYSNTYIQISFPSLLDICIRAKRYRF